MLAFFVLSLCILFFCLFLVLDFTQNFSNFCKIAQHRCMIKCSQTFNMGVASSRINCFDSFDVGCFLACRNGYIAFKGCRLRVRFSIKQYSLCPWEKYFALISL